MRFKPALLILQSFFLFFIVLYLLIKPGILLQYGRGFQQVRYRDRLMHLLQKIKNLLLRPGFLLRTVKRLHRFRIAFLIFICYGLYLVKDALSSLQRIDAGKVFIDLVIHIAFFTAAHRGEQVFHCQLCLAPQKISLCFAV